MALRNVFDKYWQPENRVTHALMTALREDRKLLGRFLRELVKVKLPRDPAAFLTDGFSITSGGACLLKAR
jgi:hypothetical protein